MALKYIALALVAIGLAACGNGRSYFPAGCTTDGSVVWMAYPNSQGSYQGLDINTANCAKAH